MGNKRFPSALSLPEQSCVVLLIYFLPGYTDMQIGNTYRQSRIRNKKLMAFYCVTKRVYRRLDGIPVFLCAWYGSHSISV